MERGTELLAPGGSFDGIKLAAAAGADAVYVGGSKFGARAYAKNLSQEELLEAIDYVHENGVKLYLTVNTLLKERELAEELYGFLAPLYERGLDAVIVQDLGVLSFLRKEFPELPLHASTQMTVTGLDGVRYLEERGVKRVVLARELSLDEIRHICSHTKTEIECFVHGALCVCYSGQCLMSSMLGGRSGNRGRCAQPCRLACRAEENGRALGPKGPVYALSPKDICTVDYVPELIEAGVYSFKIEGRMKRAEYAAGVTEIYRKYIDLAMADRLAGRRGERRKAAAEDKDFLEKLYTRSGFSDGYLFSQNGPEMMAMRRPDYTTADEAFYDAIRRRCSNQRGHKKLHGKLKLLKGKEAILEIEEESLGLHTAVAGSVVQEAKTRPLDEKTIRRQMEKTKDTPFYFASLKIEEDPDIFLPVQALNSLRREGIASLTWQLLERYRRKPIERRLQERQRENADVRGDGKIAGMGVRCLVKTEEQLKAALESSYVEAVYLDMELVWDKPKETADTCRRTGKRCYVALPYIFREKVRASIEGVFLQIAAAGFDGMLCRNLDELGYLKSKGYRGEILSDYMLYGMNREAEAFLRKDSSWGCAPVELNARELKSLDLSKCDLVVYGYIPLMITAQCMRKNLKGECPQKGLGNGSRLYLKDRYGKRFEMVSECRWCYSLLYNSLPLNLLDQEEQIAGLRCGAVRLQMTSESCAEAAALIEAFGRSFAAGEKAGRPQGEFTRGHFGRGIE